MPNPVYRSFLGVAKESTTTTLAASVAAGATSVTVVGTGVAASTTIFIWDGPNSESRAVTAGGGTSTLTVAALTYAHSANCYVTAQLTASVGPTNYIPVTTLQPADHYDMLEDKGLRGSMGEIYNVVQGVRWSEISLAGDCFPDTIGFLLGGVFGATDFTGGTPNQHAFSVKNTGNGQPTSYTFYDFDVVNTRGYAGSKISELGFKFDATGLLTWSAKTMGFASGVVANPTSSFSAITPLPAWLGVATVGGTSNLLVTDGEVNIKRAVSKIDTHDGVQDPYSIFAGALTVDGKVTFVMEDDTQLLNYINNSQPSLDFTWSSGTGASQTAITFHMTKAAYTTGQPERGKDYIALPVSFEGVYNATDATTSGAGLSPIKVTIKNSVATGSYL